MPAVKKIEKIVSKETLDADIKSLCFMVHPAWKEEEFSYKKLAGGLINEIYKCSVKSDQTEKDTLIVRIYSSQNISDMVDRNKELFGMQVAQATGVAEPLYIMFTNGLVYGYAPGGLGYWGMLWDDKLSRQFMEILTKFHDVDITKLEMLNKNGELTTLKPKLSIFNNLRQAVKDIPDKFVNFPDRQKKMERLFWSKSQLSEEIEKLENFFAKFDFRVVFSHNDAWVWNVIFNKETEKISLIDFEFADFNYEAADLGSLFQCFQLFEEYNQFMPPEMNTTKEELKLPRTAAHRRKLTKMYLEERCIRQGKKQTDFTEEEFEKFHNQALMMEIFTLLYWSTFLMTQFDDPEVPWDCMSYAEISLNKYISQRDDLFAFKP